MPCTWTGIPLRSIPVGDGWLDFRRKESMKKLAFANIGIATAMLVMLIVAEALRVKQVFGVIIGIYWVLLDIAVFIVAIITGVFLLKSSKDI
jgi:hypothetical protein